MTSHRKAAGNRKQAKRIMRIAEFACLPCTILGLRSAGRQGMRNRNNEGGMRGDG